MEQVLFARKSYAQMLDWKSRMADRYALLIEGARRVGKTFLIREFVSKEYESSIYIDFSHADKLTKATKREFEQADGVEDLLTRLELLYKVRLIPASVQRVSRLQLRLPLSMRLILPWFSCCNSPRSFRCSVD